MQKLPNFIAGIAFSMAFALPLHAEDVNAASIVATVNGTEITLGQMIIARAQLPQEYQSLPPEILFKGVMEQLVQQQLLADTIGSDLPTRLQAAIDNEMRSLRAGEAVERMAEQAVTEDALQAAYDTQYGSLTPENEFNAAHILVETEEEAKQLLIALSDGADFGELAKEKSTGPSGPNGGNLGWFGKGAMVPSFEAAVLELKEGEVSAPVSTQFGWHVVKLIGIREIPIPTLDEVRTELEGTLAREAVQANLVELEANATVTQIEEGEIDPNLLTNLDLLKD